VIYLSTLRLFESPRDVVSSFFEEETLVLKLTT
jgi:hypothetical protein